MHKTSFRTHYGHYEFTIILCGLINAPVVFMAFMNHVFEPFLDWFVIDFIDDMLVYSRSDDEHEGHFRKVLQVLRGRKLFAKLKKFKFWLQKVALMRHIISKVGISLDYKRVETNKDYPRLQILSIFKALLN